MAFGLLLLAMLLCLQLLLCWKEIRHNFSSLFLGYGKFFEDYFLLIFISTYLYWAYDLHSLSSSEERYQYV